MSEMLKTIIFYDLFLYIFIYLNIIYLIKISFAQENHFEDDESQIVYPSKGQKLKFLGFIFSL